MASLLRRAHLALTSGSAALLTPCAWQVDTHSFTLLSSGWMPPTANTCQSKDGERLGAGGHGPAGGAHPLDASAHEHLGTPAAQPFEYVTTPFRDSACWTCCKCAGWTLAGLLLPEPPSAWVRALLVSRRFFQRVCRMYGILRPETGANYAQRPAKSPAARQTRGFCVACS